ncbi:MAG: putative nucleotidyltransferase component of viral defense system [Planctomycetota bacterium]
MSQHYASPIAFKQAVEQRLRTQSTELSVDLARTRQLLIFDRFLCRLSLHFGERVILKGGLALELRLERARTTNDVDLRMLGNPEATLKSLQEAGRIDLGDFLRYEIEPDHRHHTIDADGMLYEGRRYRAHADLAGKIYGSQFGVDVAFAEPIIGAIDQVESSQFLEFAGLSSIPLRIYPLEAHIAEKLHALTVPRKSPNSRVKDLPDVCLLATSRTIDAQVLRDAIRNTFSSRDTHPVPRNLPAPPENWSEVYERIASGNQLKWTTLSQVSKFAALFLDPVLAEVDGTWSPQEWVWQ